MRLRRRREEAALAVRDPISANIAGASAVLLRHSGRGQPLGVNAAASLLHLPRFDDPPFAWLQGAVGLGALLMTSVILIAQNRQGKLAERREQLELQMSLLTEQRTAKIVGLLEELHRDMPSVVNRVDLEAEALGTPRRRRKAPGW